MSKSIRVGTRGSKLALTQTRWVVARLNELRPDVPIELEIIKTVGDRVQDRPIEEIGVQGAFTKELDTALLERRIDAAVHSLKDLPTLPVAGITIAAMPEREDPRDAFIGKTASRLTELPRGAKIGTSSLRRIAQLAALRPDIDPVAMRGNIDTRLRKLQESDELDAIILAAAGLRRLGMANVITQFLELEHWLPAPGQGALAVAARTDDDFVNEVLKTLDHMPTRVAVTAERRMLAFVEGGCSVPVGAYAHVDGGELTLEGVVASPNGHVVVRDRVSGEISDPVEVGEALAEKLLSRGGREVLADLQDRQ